MDIINLKTVDRELQIDQIIKRRDVQSTYGMGVNLQEQITQDILSVTQQFTPQFPAMGEGFENRPYVVFDSRKTPKK
jgi:hypothetical protein